MLPFFILAGNAGTPTGSSGGGAHVQWIVIVVIVIAALIGMGLRFLRRK